MRFHKSILFHKFSKVFFIFTCVFVGFVILYRRGDQYAKLCRKIK
nr:MAG TPA: hypothetical protein [Caudoviricetes sp.]